MAVDLEILGFTVADAANNHDGYDIYFPDELRSNIWIRGLSTVEYSINLEYSASKSGTIVSGYLDFYTDEATPQKLLTVGTSKTATVGSNKLWDIDGTLNLNSLTIYGETTPYSGPMKVIARATIIESASINMLVQDPIDVSAEVYPWSIPSIVGFSIGRCDADGTPNVVGSRAKFSISYVVSPVGNLNIRSLVIRWRPATITSGWTGSQTIDIDGYEYTDEVLDYILDETFDPAVKYTVAAHLRDGISTGDELGGVFNLKTLQPAGAVVHLSGDKTRIAFHKRCETGVDAPAIDFGGEGGMFRFAPDYADPAAAVRALGLAPLDASAFPVAIHEYLTAESFPLFWNAYNSGTNEQLGSVVNHPGILVIKSSSSANSGGESRFSIGSYCLQGGDVFEHVFRLPTLSNVGHRYGYHNSQTSAAPTDGAWINIGASGALTGKTRKASTESTTASSYTISANTWYRIRVAVNNNRTLVTFSLYAENGTLLWTNTLSTNIPTESINVCALAFKTSSGATAIAHWDWTMAKIDRALTR